jgi:hypothetical protein
MRNMREIEKICWNIGVDYRDISGMSGMSGMSDKSKGMINIGEFLPYMVMIEEIVGQRGEITKRGGRGGGNEISGYKGELRGKKAKEFYIKIMGGIYKKEMGKQRKIEEVKRIEGAVDQNKDRRKDIIFDGSKIVQRNGIRNQIDSYTDLKQTNGGSIKSHR